MSRTANFIALTRALANLAPEVPEFEDDISERLLPPSDAAAVERARRRLPQSPYAFSLPRGMGVFNQFRTVVLDRALAAAAPVEQLVILGAGLDGRAHRLASLRTATVFEVDHPETQAAKRQRAADLPSRAREIRYVAMDFRHDDLVEKLREAGHQSSRPTFWLLEGVTMYLTREQVGHMMAQLASLSTPGSQLALTYFSGAHRSLGKRLMLAWIGILIGARFRSSFHVRQLHALAGSMGWDIVSDTGVEDWMGDLAPGVSVSKRAVGIQWAERIWIGKRR